MPPLRRVANSILHDGGQWAISRETHVIDGNRFITQLELEIKIKDIGMTDDKQNET
ncbi:hypothetical protein MC862_001535 [Proteus mirabilis]